MYRLGSVLLIGFLVAIVGCVPVQVSENKQPTITAKEAFRVFSKDSLGVMVLRTNRLPPEESGTEDMELYAKICQALGENYAFQERGNKAPGLARNYETRLYVYIYDGGYVALANHDSHAGDIDEVIRLLTEKLGKGPSFEPDELDFISELTVIIGVD